MYKGPLLEPYLARKDGNMKGTVDSLFKKYTDKEKIKVSMTEKHSKEVKRMVKKGMKRKDISEKLGITIRTVYNALHYGE